MAEQPRPIRSQKLHKNRTPRSTKFHSRTFSQALVKTRGTNANTPEHARSHGYFPAAGVSKLDQNLLQDGTPPLSGATSYIRTLLKSLGWMLQSVSLCSRSRQLQLSITLCREWIRTCAKFEKPAMHTWTPSSHAAASSLRFGGYAWCAVKQISDGGGLHTGWRKFRREALQNVIHCE